MTVSRRQLLTSSLAGGALLGLGCGRGARTASPGPRSSGDVTPASSSTGAAARPAGGAAARPPVPDVPGLVALIRAASRDDAVPRVAQLVRRGLAAGDLIVALQLAAATDVVPRTGFGPDHHAHLVVRSAQLASAAAAPGEEWFPLLWALDFYKQAQERSREYDPEPLAPFPRSRAVPPEQAAAELARGMDSWDQERVESALLSLHEAGRYDQLAELAMRYGARDFREIGHKAIFVANALAVLRETGRHSSAAVVRSIGMTLPKHYDQEGRDFDSDWSRNLARAKEMRADWQSGRPDPRATTDLLAVLRSGDQDDSSAALARAVASGVAPSSLWDAVLCSAAELSMNRPGNVLALHAVTTANASYAAYRHSRTDDNRSIILLQAAARAAFYVDYATEHSRDRGKPMTEARMDELEPAPAGARWREDIAAIFEDPRADPVATAQRALGVLAVPGAAQVLLARVRSQTVHKATDSHDLKVTSAFIEDLPHVGADFRDRYLACCLGEVKPGKAPDTPVSEGIARALRDARG